MLPVGLAELGGEGVGAGGGEQVVVVVDGEDLAVGRGCSVDAAGSRRSAAGSGPGVSVGLIATVIPFGQVAVIAVEVDREVVGGEPAGDRRCAVGSV